MPTFPHLNSDEQFPYLDRAEPFERKTEFDYTRYDYTATVKLCNATWPLDMRHAPYWKSVTERDSWFASIEGRTFELAQGFAHVQTESIVLDIPYDVALTFNYAYMTVPQLTEDEPIRHEIEGGIRTICAHVRDCVYQTPSTTLFVLALDYWSTYLPYLNVRQLMLRRGHAPMYDMSASEFLADPVRRCTHLLTPDVNFGGEAEVVRSGEFKPLSTAEPIYILSSTIPYDDVSFLAEAQWTTATMPTFSDTSARDGHQVNVDGFAWNTYGANGLYNPSEPSACVDGSTPSGLYYYGFYASAIASLKRVLARYPLLAKSCRALYVVPSDLVSVGTSHNVEGVTFYEVRSNSDFQSVGDFTLSKSMFSYPDRYADIAKLYTSPYASLEIADDLGNTVELLIENCHGTLEVIQHLNAAWPFLSWDAMLSNYASSDTTRSRYTWAKVSDGTIETRQIPNADFISTALSFGIDTYELHMDAAPMAQLASYFDAQMERERAIVAYQSTMRSANTSLENTLDTDATANTNALASNATANANALASNATANENALASNATANANALASNATANANALRSASNERANATINADTIEAIAIEEDARIWGNYDASLDYLHGTGGFDGMIAQTKEYQLAMHNAGMDSTEISGLTGIAGQMMAGDSVGAASAAVSMMVTLAKNSTQFSAADDFYDSQTYWQQELNEANAQIQGQYNAESSDLRIDQVNDVASNNLTTSTSNANATKSTSDANANRTKGMSDANANRTKGTSDANANRTKGTSDANANRTKGTSDANAGFSRATTEENAKSALLLAQDSYTTMVESAGVDNPNSYGDYAGDGLAGSYRMRGVHLRVKTQGEGAIARTGDTFLRYGYTYDGIWNVDEWCDSEHQFCYWQASDLWLNSAEIANSQAERALESMLDSGITVWRDPDLIGLVTI